MKQGSDAMIICIDVEEKHHTKRPLLLPLLLNHALATGNKNLAVQCKRKSFQLRWAVTVWFCSFAHISLQNPTLQRLGVGALLPLWINSQVHALYRIMQGDGNSQP